MNSGLTGVMFESESGRDHDFYGFLRLGGAEYKFQARRDDRGGQPRWALRLAPRESERCETPSEAGQAAA
jgi:hypothetical protein